MARGRPLLVIVTGPPASGKTTLAAGVAQRLGIPAFHKDEIKERLADEIPGHSLAWSQRLGGGAYGILQHLGRVLIDAGCSCLLEANFHPRLSLAGLQPLAEQVHVAQIVCTGEPDVLMERYFSRHGEGARHPVHLDSDPARSEQLAASFRRDHTLALDGLTLVYDTTTGKPIDPDDVVERINRWAARFAVQGARSDTDRDGPSHRSCR